MIVYSLDKLFFMFAFSPIQLSHEFTSPLLLLLLSPFPLLGKMCSSPRISQAAFCCCCCNRLYQLSQLKQVTQYRENSKERGRRRSQLVLSQQIERSCYCCSCYPTEAFTIQEPQNPSIDFSKQQKSTGFGGSKLEKKCSVRYCFPALSILAPSVFLVLHVLLLQAAASRSMAAVLSKRSFLLHQHIEQKCCKPPSVVVQLKSGILTLKKNQQQTSLITLYLNLRMQLRSLLSMDQQEFCSQVELPWKRQGSKVGN